MRTIIYRVERLRNDRNGNPRFKVSIWEMLDYYRVASIVIDKILKTYKDEKQIVFEIVKNHENIPCQYHFVNLDYC
jgi:hypothetical protein